MVLKSVLALFFLQYGQRTCRGSEDDPASNQLIDYWRNNQVAKNYTTASGLPVRDPGVVLAVGKKGPMLQDMTFLEEIQHFNRERIPERVVHAKGAGAWGYLKVTNTEVTKYCSAAFLNELEKITKVFIRFSTTNGELGSADTVQGSKGFAVKFYTEEGNWDLPGLIFPVFFIRDPMLFSSLTHNAGRNPVTHIEDPIMRWDFLTKTPSSVLASLYAASSWALPRSYRHTDGFGVNTYKLVNDKGEIFYCKFILKTHQGLINMPLSEGEWLRGEDPDYYVRDLYNNIAQGNFPKWTFGVQIMTPEQTKTFRWNYLDPTKFWPEEDYPFLPIGVVTLNKNPTDFFLEVEQSSFCPSKLVPGIRASNDKVLQGRLFSYEDTIVYRLGVNNELMKVNKPLAAPPVANRERDGKARTDSNQKGSPNYDPNSYNGPVGNPRGHEPPFPVYGNVSKYDTLAEDDDFSQPAIFWNKISEAEQDVIVYSLVNVLKKVPPFIQVVGFGHLRYCEEKSNKELWKSGFSVRKSTRGRTR